MSVEDIQKVNDLAQELLKKGFVGSREEAVQKAQEMLNKEITGAAQIKETDEKQNIAASGDDPEKLRNMVERTKEYVERQFNGYKNALIALEKEINALKQQVSELKTKAAKPDPAEEPMKVEKSGDPAEEPQKVEEKKDSHPKVGRNNPEDVSIEKMFYFGNKKQD